MQSNSPALHVGNNNSVKSDDYDLNQNGIGCCAERNPDLDGNWRILGPANDLDVDMGAYERGNYCWADINCDNLVSVGDLLAVINMWGCPGSSCCADVSSAPLRKGTVNVSDLLLVINSWGPCPGYSGVVGSLETVQDCMDACSEGYTPYTPEWSACVQECINALCEAGKLPPGDCDD